jgi:hypothetical protein
MKLKYSAALVSALGLLAAPQAAAALLYSLDHNNLPASGSIYYWDGALPTPYSAPTPQVTVINGQKWSMNLAYPAGTPTGYRLANPTSSIALNGASFVVAVTRNSAGINTPWNSVIDVMYDKLVLGVRDDTGQVVVRRNGSLDFSVGTIDVGQSVVLSLTVQTDGSYEAWADGLSMLVGAASGTMTEWDPNRLGETGNPVVPFMTTINVGRNNPDGWTAFNGAIGDVKIFDAALSNSERLIEVSSMTAAMGIPEPSSTLLLGLAGGLLAFRRPRRA